MRSPRFVVLFFVVFVTIVVHASGAREPIAVGAYSELSAPNVSFDIGRSLTEGPQYQANTELQGGFTVRYGRYGASLSPPIFGSGREYPEHPPTRYFDLRLRYFANRWGVESYHQYFRGFYLTTADDSLIRNNSSLRLRNSNFNLYLAATEGSRLWRMQEALNSTGLRLNLYYLAGLSRLELDSPTPFLGGYAEAAGTRFETMNRVQALSVTGGAGATLNINLWGLYFDPTLFMAGGVQRRESNLEASSTGGTLKVHLRTRTGFRGKKFDVGLEVVNDANGVMFSDNEEFLVHSIVVRMGLMLYFD